jgi:hypothetical protein
MYAVTPTPAGRPSLGPGSKLTRPRVSLGGSLASPTFSSSSQNNTTNNNNLRRTATTPAASSPGSRPATMTPARANGAVSQAGSPESIRVGDTVRSPTGEVGTVKYAPPK